MVADQEPTTSEHKHWTRFLNRDTAFYMGPEEIARVTRFPVFFIDMRAPVARLLRDGSSSRWRSPERSCRPGELTERYARLVEAADPRRPARLAVVAQALEAEEVGVPAARARRLKLPSAAR